VVLQSNFFGAFEIPRCLIALINKVDKASTAGRHHDCFHGADAGGFFFPAPDCDELDCIESVLSSDGGATALECGTLGFGFGLGIPFTVAIFPSWMNNLPKSGGWLNTVKVLQDFFKLAFAFKFLSKRRSERPGKTRLVATRVFIATWIAIFGAMAFIYLEKSGCLDDKDQETTICPAVCYYHSGTASPCI
jgi:thiol:disulfide interchange protein DsbD